jgi:chromosome segregation ATPase
MNDGLHGDMVRTLNNALAQAVQATTAVEKERDEAIQGRQLMAKSLATITDKAASLQALLEQERAAAASRLQSLSTEHEAALAEREVERRRRSALEEELEASRQRAERLDSELWRNAEQTVDAGSRLGGLQQEVAEQRGCTRAAHLLTHTHTHTHTATHTVTHTDTPTDTHTHTDTHRTPSSHSLTH